MSKAHKRLALALLAASLCARAAAAQGAPAPAQSTAAAAPEWVSVSPAGEEFSARMPKEPLRLEQEVRVGEFPAAGRRYTAKAGGARYVVWSLNDSRNVGEGLGGMSLPGWAARGESMYLDLLAEAAWKLLVEPEFERLEIEGARTGGQERVHPADVAATRVRAGRASRARVRGQAGGRGRPRLEYNFNIY